MCYYYSNGKSFEVSELTINMPKKEKLNESNTKPIEIQRTLSYELNNKSECFDPSTSGSPSNVFMTTLKNRMDEYYSETRLFSIPRRERANSMEMLIRKNH
jgi:hypothetical protein